MPHLQNILRLAEAVERLCRAQDELTAAGYDQWARQLGELIETLDIEISWLQTTSPGDQKSVTS